VAVQFFPKRAARILGASAFRRAARGLVSACYAAGSGDRLHLYDFRIYRLATTH
jgi:hypothetical protein